MFDIREYYKKENASAKACSETLFSTIKDIVEETSLVKDSNEKAPFLRYLNHTGRFILELVECEKRIHISYFETTGFDVLKNENQRLYSDIHPDSYGCSYADPANSVAQLGDRFGQALSYFYARIRQSIQHAFQHKFFRIVELGDTFVDLYGQIHAGPLNYDDLQSRIIKDPQNPKVRDSVHELQENFSEEYGYLTDIVKESDLNDLRYLFKYGRCISGTELTNARFILEYPEDKIRKLSEQIVKSYVTGFRRDNKDISRKSTVRIFYSIGYERIVRHLMEGMLEIGLKPLIGSVFSKTPNRQYAHDHKFDAALYLNENCVDRSVNCMAQACEQLRPELAEYSGSVLIENFGEEPFVPETKGEALKFSEEHQRLTRDYQNRRTEIIEKYMPRIETSFSMISFPSPDIGESFPDIFDSIYTVNMLDTEKYERIQQNIINELDKAEYVHIKGRGSCETDIKVKMHVLSDPSKETNFMNCGADVNIPVGEVFTSPMLRGTNGMLHIEQTFLNGLRYDNLKLVFQEGYISEYSCSNYDHEEDNRRYIEENLLFPHKTLPIGEFAIGTNTLAYAISKKYDILSLLPILIIEKMGPHFAIGDTCFRHEEDLPTYNELDGKEIIARENERSSVRKEKPEEAYTYCHTDITIPYESIACISAITKENSRIDIIRDGIFVLNGTEELNVPLMQCK